MKDSNLVYDRCVIEVFSISTVMWRSQSFLHRHFTEELCRPTGKHRGVRHF